MTARSVVEWAERRLADASRITSATALLAVVALVSLQVANRYLPLTGFVWTEELARAGLIWMTFLASAALMADQRHIAVDVVTARLSEQKQRAVAVFTDVIVLLVVSALLPDLFERTLRMSSMQTTAAELSMFVFVGPILIGFVLMGIHALLHLIRTVLSAR